MPLPLNANESISAPRTSVPAVEVRELGWSSQNRTILQDISFQVRPGRLVAIVGPNGAGKSTLIRLIMGLIRPSVGTVHLFGQPVSARAPWQLARMVAYVPQSIHQLLPFSVLDYVVMGRYARTVKRFGYSQRDYEIAFECLSQAGIASLARRSMDRLSGGERQQVMLVAALAQETPLILLDEPTAALDPCHAVDLAYHIREQHQSHQKTILFVTHDINFAMGTAEELLGIREGRLIFRGTTEELGTTKGLERLYGIPFQSFSPADRNFSSSFWYPVRKEPHE